MTKLLQFAAILRVQSSIYPDSRVYIVEKSFVIKSKMDVVWFGIPNWSS